MRMPKNGQLGVGLRMSDRLIESRVDRLIAVLINDYFPYYSLWPVEEARPSQEIMSLMDGGYNLWRSAVFRKQPNEEINKWMVVYRKL